jgi:hypothetical protein
MALTDDLVSYYKFEGDATDETGSYDGSVQGASVTASGLIGSAYSFDGSNDYISTSASMGNFSTAGTWSFWIKTSDSDTGTVANRFISKNAVSPNRSYFIQLDGGVLKIFGSDDGSNINLSYTVLSSTIINDDDWHHIVIAYEGGARTIKTYIDSMLAGTLTSADGVPASFNTSNIVTSFGSTDGAAVLNGILDEMGFWSRELDSTEVTQLYNSGSGLTYPFVGWTGTILGISSPAKVIGVELANISKVNGV